MHNINNIQQLLTDFSPYILILTIWSLIWKGFALWKAGRNNSPIWFIIILIVNTAGLLEIIYLFGIKNKEAVSENVVPTPTQEVQTETKVETITEEKKEEITTPTAEVKTEEIKQETNQ